MLKEAFYIARTGRPGPVVVDVAKDVFDTKIDYSYPEAVHLRGCSGENIGDESEIDVVVEAIRAAKKPLVFAGGGIMISNLPDAMRDIVRRLGVPSTATLLGLGAIPADEKGYLSFAGMHGSYGANMAIQECDLLLCIGMRFSDRVTGKVDEFAPHAKVVHFEIDRAEINKNVKADYSVLGDLSWSLPLLRDKLNACEDDFASKFAPWLACARARGKASVRLSRGRRGHQAGCAHQQGQQPHGPRCDRRDGCRPAPDVGGTVLQVSTTRRT